MEGETGGGGKLLQFRDCDVLHAGVQVREVRGVEGGRERGMGEKERGVGEREMEEHWYLTYSIV